jgi:hypothetical protein
MQPYITNNVATHTIAIGRPPQHTLRNECFFLPNEEGREGVRPIRFFLSHDALWGCWGGLTSLKATSVTLVFEVDARLAMALAGRPRPPGISVNGPFTIVAQIFLNYIVTSRRHTHEDDA